MTSFQREQQSNDFSIQSYNFGGLNTTASRLNVPFNDASELLNVNTGLDGSLLKRRGTQFLDKPFTPASTGYGVGIRSVLGYNYSVLAQGRSLVIYSRSSDNYNRIRTFTNVYTNTAKPEPTSWVQLPDTYSRLLALRADRAPVEVYLLEERIQTFTVLANTSSLVVSQKFKGDNNDFSGVFTDTVYLTVNGVQTVYANLSYVNSSVLTLNLPVVLNVNDEVSVDIVGFRWSWYAESIKWEGDRFFDALNRFNVTANDNNVAISEGLRSDLQGEDIRLIALPTDVSGTSYTRALQPSTPTDYGLSDGSVYVPNANNFIAYAPFFITFGTTRLPLPQPAESVKVLRFRETRFNQTGRIKGENLRVTVKDVLVQPNYTNTVTGTNRYIMIDNNTLVNNPTQEMTILGFSGSSPVGVGATDTVTMTNVERVGFSTALQLEFEESNFRSGSYTRAYGLGYFSTYSPSGTAHPSVGCVYQGRLALSGISTDKSRVLLSSVDNSQDRYTYFQITDDLAGLATDPFDVLVSGGDSADYIVGLVEWNNSLFTLTRRSVYRVSGGDQPLTATRRLVTYISNIGLVNTRSIVRTDNAVYYLSDGGVFNLTPRVEDSEFSAIEKSLKVRGLILNRNTASMVSSAHMNFDNRLRRLYVALPNSGDSANEASDLLVFDTVRESWTLYGLLGQLRAQSIYENVDNVSGSNGVIVCTNSGHLLLEGELYIDSAKKYPNIDSLGLGLIHTHTAIVGYAVTATLANQRYDIPPGIQTSSINAIRDLRVFVTSLGVTNEVTFTKYNSHVYLTEPTDANATLVWFVARSTVNDSTQGLAHYGSGNLYPITVRVDKLVLLPTQYSSTTLTFNLSSRVATVTIVFPVPTQDTPCVVGQHYQSSYISSMFTQQVLGALKRTKHAYLYFNNNESSTTTKGIDVEVYNTRVNVNVAMLYDSDDSDANTSADIYGYQDILWDNAYFDTVESAFRQEPYSLFKEPLIGIGYSYRINVYSYDDARWNLVGYQIDASQSKGLRYIQAE